MKVLFKGPINSYSGYGSDSIGIIQALQRWGCDVYLQPTCISAPVPPSVAYLLTKTLEAPFDLHYLHVPPEQMEVTPEARAACDLVVGQFMWEMTSILNQSKRSSLKKRLKPLDLLLTYHDVDQEAFRPYVSKGTELRKLQGGYWPELWKPQTRDWYSDRFGFCSLGDLHNRKDPFTTINAFLELKRSGELEHAELHLKDIGTNFHPLMDGAYAEHKIRVHRGSWPPETMLQFYKMQHCLISSSRGEGKNLPALEMLSTGGTVIATDFAGHREWLDKSYSYPLNYTLTKVDPARFGDKCLWAAADKEHLKELMLHVYNNRSEARQKGELGSRIIPQMMSWDKKIEDLFRIISLNLGPEGKFFWQKAIACRQDVPKERPYE